MSDFTLPRGLNHNDIKDGFQDVHQPVPCEVCGKMASSKSLLASRKHWKMDLCAGCRHKKYTGTLGDPKEDIEQLSALDTYGESEDLPF